MLSNGIKGVCVCKQERRENLTTQVKSKFAIGDFT